MRPLDVVRARPALLNLVSLLFVLNCLLPYFGLKTAQTVTMFANLRLEGGVSNHLIMAHAPRPFGYIEDVVEVRSGAGSRKFLRAAEEGLWLTWYSLLDELDRNPGARVTYVRDGVLHVDRTAADVAHEIETVLHPRWVRKWFHFSPVDVTRPKPCALDR